MRTGRGLSPPGSVLHKPEVLSFASLLCDFLNRQHGDILRTVALPRPGRVCAPSVRLWESSVDIGMQIRKALLSLVSS